MSEPTEDQTTAAPDWAFSSEQDLRCPTCNAVLAGLNWVMTEEAGNVRATGMALVPCDHVLDTDTWELQYTGRERLSGAIIRTPRFTQRKKT